MLTWKSHRSPLREHFSFQANMRKRCARTLAGGPGHPRASARVVLSVVSIVLDTQKTDVNFEIQSVTAK